MTDTAKIDGRLLRSQRSKQRIADTLYELIGEGHLEPSAQRVSERAGVGIRTVFRLFDDMESLYATVDERLQSEVAALIDADPDPDAPMGLRMERHIANRTELFERFGVYMRATHRHRYRSKFLAEQSRVLLLRLRKRLQIWIPELRGASPEIFEALDQALSFEAWDRLRGDQKLSRKRAHAAMLAAARALLEQLARGQS